MSKDNHASAIGDIYAVEVPRGATEEQLAAYEGVIKELGWLPLTRGMVSIERHFKDSAFIDLKDANGIKETPFLRQFNELKNMGLQEVFMFHPRYSESADSSAWELWSILRLSESEKIIHPLMGGTIAVHADLTSEGRRYLTIEFGPTGNHTEFDEKLIDEEIWEQLESIRTTLGEYETNDTVYDWLHDQNVV